MASADNRTHDSAAHHDGRIAHERGIVAAAVYRIDFGPFGDGDRGVVHERCSVRAAVHVPAKRDVRADGDGDAVCVQGVRVAGEASAHRYAIIDG